IHSMDVRSLVAEIRRESGRRPGRERADADGCAHFCAGIRRPISTGGPGIQAVDQTGLGCDIEGIALDHRLPGCHWSGMSKGPFDLELRDIFRPDTGLWLESGIMEIKTPAAPLWTIKVDRPESRFAKVRFRINARARSGLLPGQVNCKGANLI